MAALMFDKMLELTEANEVLSLRVEKMIDQQFNTQDYNLPDTAENFDVNDTDADVTNSQVGEEDDGTIRSQFK
jgi:hypothetical protein